ncbi:unnamed protein product [Phytophthora fragariaefolia]|uniref:Unnamed protein product n=1 Tax=Phytophthora fragariaefolia TaxID=1490495 RepID=A0A9W6XK88_9STRA|nr:unnamed protein product [Phytophthora fragariaefolia]
MQLTNCYFDLVMVHMDRFEVYCGSKQHAIDAHKQNKKSGSAVVVRNLLEVFGREARKQPMKLVVIDHFYTSVALAVQLLLMYLWTPIALVLL